MSSYAERVNEAHQRYRAAIGTKYEASVYVDLVCVVRLTTASSNVGGRP